MLNLRWTAAVSYLRTSITPVVYTLVAGLCLAGSAAIAAETFPKILSINIGAKNYDDPAYQQAMSKADVVLLAFYPGWQGKPPYKTPWEVVASLKARNPNILVGQYTLLSAAAPYTGTNNANWGLGLKIEQENWWLRDAAGNRATWTTDYGTFDINITKWARPDADGRRFPQWAAGRDMLYYFKRPDFDINYIDLMISHPGVPTADWKRIGTNQKRTDSDVAAAYRQAHMDYVNEMKRYGYNRLIIPNSGGSGLLSYPEYSKQVHGAVLEAIMGLRWSVETNEGWTSAASRYNQAMNHTIAPQIVGFNVWGASNDYRMMRYGLTTTLMHNGYFSYADSAKGYSSTPWFDEFDIELGAAVDRQQPVGSAWQNGVYRRRFENGMVLLNPTNNRATVTIEAGYRKFLGTQDPGVNDGLPATNITLESKDGIVLIRDPG